MSAIVDFPYYRDTYMGKEADSTSFPALNAHAQRVIQTMTRWVVDDTNIGELPQLTQTLVKLAICSQVDFISVNGFESLTSGSSDGFTVGKVRVDKRDGSTKGGAMSASVSPAALAYLEQTGLLYCGVGVAQC